VSKKAIERSYIMKKVFKFLATVFATICCFGIFAGCNTGKTITIGYTEYEPMNYMEDGKLVGFDTELAEKTFGELGYKVRFKLIDWANKYTELDGGTIDCVWNGFTANCADDDGIQRSDKVDFSYNYMTNAQCVIRLQTSEELALKADLAGKSVACEGGSAGDSYVAGITGVNKKAVNSQMDAVREVSAGTAQYAVVDLLLAQSIAGQGDFANIKINESIVIDAEYYAIGFKKGSELTAKVNEKLVAYAQNGYLAELAEKYGLSTQVITDFSSQIA
jgi:polar amino acid transport system substrate-binding protein